MEDGVESEKLISENDVEEEEDMSNDDFELGQRKGNKRRRWEYSFFKCK